MQLRSLALAAITATAAPSLLAAQTEGFEAFLMSTSAETALARSAAPANVADSADLYLLGREGYERVDLGTNGFACLVERAWQDATLRAPICYNPLAVDDVLPVRLFEAEEAAAGNDPSAIREAVSAAYASGRFRAPESGAFSYMMSGGQQLGAAGRAFPHVMFYTAYLSNADVGGHTRGARLPNVFQREGEPGAVLVVGTPDFVSVREPRLSVIDEGARGRVLRHLDANEIRLRAATRGLSADEWTQRPDADSWSPAEIVEHIAAAESGLLGQVVRAVEAGPPTRAFRSTHADERVRHVLLDRGERFKTVPAMVPSQRFGDHSGSLASLATSRATLRTFIAEMPAGLRDYGFDSPVGAEPIDGYQMILLTAAHAERHVEQLEETVTRLRSAGATASR